MSHVQPKENTLQRLACRALVLLTVTASLGSCDSVLGIEQAKLDPALADGGDAGPTGSPLCVAYCSAVTRNCTGANAQYGDLKTCLDVCAVLAEGVPDEIGVNTVQCRLKMAQSAPAEPESFCSAAGPAGELPGGGNGCGTPCDGFCSLVTAFCVSPSDPDLGYPDVQACYDDCMQLPDLGSFSLAADSGSAAGPEVQCRVYHASAASQLAELHCQHALGAAPCQ